MVVVVVVGSGSPSLKLYDSVLLIIIISSIISIVLIIICISPTS